MTKPNRKPWERALDTMPADQRQALDAHARSFTGPGRVYFIRRVLAELDVRPIENRPLERPSITTKGLEHLRTDYGRGLLERRLRGCLTTIRELAARAGAAPPCARCGKPATTKGRDPYTDDELDICAGCAAILSGDATHGLTDSDYARAQERTRRGGLPIDNDEPDA